MAFPEMPTLSASAINQVARVPISEEMPRTTQTNTLKSPSTTPPASVISTTAGPTYLCG